MSLGVSACWLIIVQTERRNIMENTRLKRNVHWLGLVCLMAMAALVLIAAAPSTGSKDVIGGSGAAYEQFDGVVVVGAIAGRRASGFGQQADRSQRREQDCQCLFGQQPRDGDRPGRPDTGHTRRSQYH